MRVSLLFPVLRPKNELLLNVEKAVQFLATISKKSNDHEILICLNPGKLDSDETKVLGLITSRFSIVRVIKPALELGKGAALKRGILSSRGKYIFFTDDDLPYCLSFFKHAITELESGYDWVIGGRRNSDTRLDMNESCRSFFLRRAFFGAAYNKVIRALFRISFHDTQAGIKAYKREFALQAVSLQRSTEFLFDLEHFLVAKQSDAKIKELPVEYRVKSEESSIRLRKEIPKAIFGVAQIVFFNFIGFYSKKTRTIKVSILEESTETD